MAKISAKKVTLWELRFHFNRKNNNVGSKRFWVRQTSMERHSKGGFHVFVKEQKLLNGKFMILAANKRAFYYSYQYDFSTFLLVLESIFYRWIDAVSIDYYSAFWFFKVIFSSICYVFWIFFNTKTEKRFPVYGKKIIVILAGALFHSAEKFLKWTLSLKGTFKIKQSKKCRKKWTIYYVKYKAVHWYY